MIFVLKMLFTFVYDRKNENHWSLLIIRYSLLITNYSEYTEHLQIWYADLKSLFTSFEIYFVRDL